MKRFDLEKCRYNRYWVSYFSENLPKKIIALKLKNWSNDLGFEYWTLCSVLGFKHLSSDMFIYFDVNKEAELMRFKAAFYLIVSFEYDVDLFIDNDLCASLVDTVMSIFSDTIHKETIKFLINNYAWIEI